MKLPIEKAKKAGRGTSYMSVQALQGMRDHADELLNVITADTMLPDWAEFKIARASQSLTSVFEYMNHGEGALKQAQTDRTAKVEYKQVGEMVRLTVLQAGQGKFLKAVEVQRRASVFQDKVERAIEDSGLFRRWKMEDVWIESTRGGLAFSMTFDAKLIEDITNVYTSSFSKPLKDAFKAQGIAF